MALLFLERNLLQQRNLDGISLCFILDGFLNVQSLESQFQHKGSCEATWVFSIYAVLNERFTRQLIS